MITRLFWFSAFVLLTLLAALLTRDAYLASRSKHWPVTDGVVIAFYDGPNYRYTVAGKTFVGSHVSCNEFWSGNLSGNNSAKNAVRYPLDAKVNVHYYPRNPDWSALETQFDPRAIWAIAVLILVALVFFTKSLVGRLFR